MIAPRAPTCCGLSWKSFRNHILQRPYIWHIKDIVFSFKHLSCNFVSGKKRVKHVFVSEWVGKWWRQKIMAQQGLCGHNVLGCVGKVFLGQRWCVCVSAQGVWLCRSWLWLWKWHQRLYGDLGKSNAANMVDVPNICRMTHLTDISKCQGCTCV